MMRHVFLLICAKTTGELKEKLAGSWRIRQKTIYIVAEKEVLWRRTYLTWDFWRCCIRLRKRSFIVLHYGTAIFTPRKLIMKKSVSRFLVFSNMQFNHPFKTFFEYPLQKCKLIMWILIVINISCSFFGKASTRRNLLLGSGVFVLSRNSRVPENLLNCCSLLARFPPTIYSKNTSKFQIVRLRRS